MPFSCQKLFQFHCPAITRCSVTNFDDNLSICDEFFSIAKINGETTANKLFFSKKKFLKFFFSETTTLPGTIFVPSGTQRHILLIDLDKGSFNLQFKPYGDFRGD